MKKIDLRSFIHALLFTVVFITSCRGQSNSSDWNNQNSASTSQTKIDQLDDLISRYTDYEKFNGTVLVVEEGNVLYKKGFGLANMEWDIHNQPDTKFRIASITKQFTAMLIVQLASENKLDLHVPISTYLPDYPRANADQITIHHLLTHTSGTPDFDDFVNYRDIERDRYRPEELIKIFAEGKLNFTPGERYSYTNTGYVILGALIEKITGNSYEKVLQDKIFTPLNMSNSGLDNSYNVVKNRASGYSRGYVRHAHVNTNYIDMSIPYAAGSIYSTVEDLYLWDQALYSEVLVQKKYRDLLFDSYIPSRDRHYGYGWFISDMSVGNTDEQVHTLSHGGGMNGFRTYITRLPNSKSTIILLSNVERAPVREMTTAIIGILKSKSYDPKISIAYSLLDKIKTEGVPKGLAYYSEVKNAKGHYLDEHEMNIAAYELLQSDQINDAKSMFKLNVEAHPYSANVHDSYGEVLLNLGDTAQAIVSYKKSISLNPKNQNGIDVLKRIGADINHKDLYLLKTDDTWGKEIFIFPIRFARDLKYIGVEEAHFPRGWRKPDSDEFWSYIFAWHIDHTTDLAISELENSLQIYFDGLMDGVNKNKDLVPPKTIAKFHKDEDRSETPTFKGTIQIFDAFATNKVMTLNVIIKKHFCDQQKKAIVIFKFSPKAFGADIWKTLEAIKLRADVCEGF